MSKQNRTNPSVKPDTHVPSKTGIAKVLDTLAKDLWIVILDIVAVNLSYFLALIIRFYVNNQFRPTVKYYLTDFAHFAPFYTTLCVVVFVCFKLYNGMWRYAGINDMNRIIGASVITSIIQIIGTALFIRRMPITYYIIGALLQFFFVASIRFAYRFIIVEHKKIARKYSPTINVLVIGTGELARSVLHQLEDTHELNPIAIVDSQGYNVGKSMNGLPVIGICELETFIRDNNIKTVIISDTELTRERRESVCAACQNLDVEYMDYTGYLSNLGDRVSLANLLEYVACPVTIVSSESTTTYENGKQAIFDITDSYTISEVNINETGLIISTKPNKQVVFVLDNDRTKAYVGYDAWEDRHKQ